jgi:hypothetical protein
MEHAPGGRLGIEGDARRVIARNGFARGRANGRGTWTCSSDAV